MVFLLRLLPETPREAFALWQMTAEDFQPTLGVLLDGQSGWACGRPRGPRVSAAAGPEQPPGRAEGRPLPPWTGGGLACPWLCSAAGRKSLTYFSHDPRAALQEVTFDLPEVKRIFFGSFHKVLEGSRRTEACNSPA